MDLAPETLQVPLYGRIAAGEPMLLREHVVGDYTLDRKLAPAPDAFLLRVQGDSMTEVGIHDGDLVLIAPAEHTEIENGEIVAARMHGEGTVKRFFARGEDVVLEPANAEYAPILVRDIEDFAVLGRVVGLFRQLAFDSGQVNA